MQGCLSYFQAVACIASPGQRVTAQQCKVATAEIAEIQYNSPFPLQSVCSSGGAVSAFTHGAVFSSLVTACSIFEPAYLLEGPGNVRGVAFVLPCPPLNSNAYEARNILLPCFMGCCLLQGTFFADSRPSRCPEATPCSTHK